MNINNNITFTGRKEVIYGLTKASEEAKDAEVDRLMSIGAFASPSRNAKAQKHTSAMKAYVDMVVHDDAFVDTMKNIKRDKETKPIRDNLKNMDTYLNLKNAIRNCVKKTFPNLEELSLNKLWNAIIK